MNTKKKEFLEIYIMKIFARSSGYTENSFEDSEITIFVLVAV